MGDADPAGTPSSVEGTTARLVVPAEDFAFAPMFERMPDVRIEIGATATCLDDHALVHITGGEHDRNDIDSRLRTGSAVTAVECVADGTEQWSYRLQWDGRARRFMEQLVAENAMILTAHGRENRWHFRVLTPDRDALSRIYRAVTDLGCSIECRRITSYDGMDSNHAELTTEQREALTAAYETGYYHIPQDVTADELAARLDISHQALSERLHRAYEQLVEDEFVTDAEHPR